MPYVKDPGQLPRHSLEAGIVLMPIGLGCLLLGLEVAGVVLVAGGFAIGLAPILLGAIGRGGDRPSRPGHPALPTFTVWFIVIAAGAVAVEPLAAMALGWLALLWVYLRVWVI